MADFMRWGSDWFEEVRHNDLTDVIEYERPGQFIICDLKATFARQSHTVSGGDGAFYDVESWDFLLRREDVEFGGDVYRPEPGDIIRRNINNETHVYDVSHLDGEPCYVDHDRFKDTIIVHTTQRSF